MSTRITLYGARLTPFTIKVERALYWKGLAFTSEEPQRPEDYRRWSPKNGLLPVIEIDGTRVQDSAAILDLLEQRFPEPPLLASDPKLAREQRRLEQWVGETFLYQLLRWVRARVGGGAAGREGEGLGPLMRLGLIGPNGKLRPGVLDGGPGPDFEGALEELRKLLGARAYYFSERLSRADLAAYAALQGLAMDRYPGGAALLARFPTLRQHYDRVDAETAPRAAPARSPRSAPGPLPG
jgi:glutathione S-transferase